MEKSLEAHRIKKYFDLIEAPDKGEPLGKNFSHILKEFSVKAHEAVFVGDSLLDIQSAKESANIYVIAVLSGMSTDRLLNKLPKKYAPNYRIQDLSHLENVINISANFYKPSPQVH